MGVGMEADEAGAAKSLEKQGILQYESRHQR